MAIQALVAALRGVETVTKSVVDPEAAGKDATKLLLTASLITTAAKTFGKASLTNGDFRAKFLNSLKES